MARERGRVFLGRVGVPNQLGEAEIEHLDRAIGADDHVGRLEVAVDDAARVRRDEGVRDGDRNPERLVEAHSLAWNERIQALAADILHHDEVVPVGRLDLVDRDDVRVIEAEAACASCTKRRRRSASATRSAGGP